MGWDSNVVDDVCSKFLDSHAGDVGTERVNRHHGLGQFTSHDGQSQPQPLHLLALCGHLCPGACRAGADVNHRASFGHNLPGSFGYFLLRLLAATGIERVRRHVQDAHYLRLGKVHEPPFHIDGVVHFAYKDTK